MVEATIERKQTEDEKKDFIAIGTKTAKDKFLDVLKKKEQEYTKASKPFDYACAKIDFENKLRMAQEESGIREGFVNHEKIEVNMGDLDKYGSSGRFKLLAEVEEKEPHPLNKKIQVTVGFTKKFICDPKKGGRGHGIAVFKAIEEEKKK